MSTVNVTEHFEKRFKQRVAHSKRILQYADDAYCFGKPISEVKYNRLAKKLGWKSRINGSTARVYANCVYWFRGNTAITVYPIPQKLHKLV